FVRLVDNRRQRVIVLPQQVYRAEEPDAVRVAVELPHGDRVAVSRCRGQRQAQAGDGDGDRHDTSPEAGRPPAEAPRHAHQIHTSSVRTRPSAYSSTRRYAGGFSSSSNDSLPMANWRQVEGVPRIRTGPKLPSNAWWAWPNSTTLTLPEAPMTSRNCSLFCRPSSSSHVLPSVNG